jgi:mono/diheme cytochrome c family protein
VLGESHQLDQSMYHVRFLGWCIACHFFNMYIVNHNNVAASTL